MMPLKADRKENTMRVLDRFRDERICLVHTAPERFRKGDRFQWREDRPVYRITRVRHVASTSLASGGAHPCFEVRGVRIAER